MGCLMYNFAVILTHNRPKLLKQCIDAIRPQVHQVLVIDNLSDPPVRRDGDYTILYNFTQPPNISRFWNQGLDFFENISDTSEWNVALLCDDVVVPEGWFQAVETCMRAHGAAAGSTHQYTEVGSPILKTAPDSDFWNRMCGWAFILAGERGVRAEETLMWWWADSHVDRVARQNGGMVICPGPVAVNSLPNDWTNRLPAQGHQAGVDGETFRQIWGDKPW